MAEINIRNPSGQFVGKVIDDIYYTIRTKEHFMFKHQGFGISKSILGRLMGLNVKKIVFKYQGKKTIIYECDILKFCNSDKYHTFNGVKGIDEQKFVSVSEMVIK